MATDAAAAPAAPAAAPAGKKKKLLIIGVIALAVIGIAVGGYFFTRHAEPSDDSSESAAETDKSDKRKPGAKSAKKEPPVKEPIYLALDPPFVVNFQDDGGFRFLQVGVQVMSRQQAALDAVKASEPAVRNALVMLFSGQSYAALNSREGKEKLRADALAEIQKAVAGRLKGGNTVDELYFTSFVMQ